jgi:parallel beta-helix repeat protein
LDSHGHILYVGGTGPGNYTRIQDAIDNASDDDTVYVYSGFYPETLAIRTSITLMGENRSTTIIDGVERASVVTITASNVNLRGFTIQDAKPGVQYAGVDVSIASTVMITDNIISNNQSLGVYIRGPGTTRIIIDENLIRDNSYGMFLQDSPQINITYNTVLHNGVGMYLLGASSTRIIGNTVENIGLGLHLERSFFTTVSDNTFQGNKNGVYLFNSSDITISANTVLANRWYGIWLKDSTESTIERNTVFDNVDLGVYLDTSYDNTISNNTLVDNDNGIYFKDSSRNLITGNYLRNIKFDATFVTHTVLHSRNTWRSNYWERPRSIPYPILGTLKLNNTPYPWIAFDWTPLRQPPQSPLCRSMRGNGTIFYVGGDGPNNYTSIQDAIDDAQANDTVYVFHGTYFEAVVVDKPLHLTGENRTTTILDGEGTKDIVTIVANYVTLTGFSIQNGHFDILVNHSSYGSISGNNIRNGLHGVSVQNGCRSLTISQNSLFDNVYGVRLFSSTDVTVSYNSFHSYKVNAFFYGTALSHARHHWSHNYWDKPHRLPYVIFGKIRLPSITLVLINCDWVPRASE